MTRGIPAETAARASGGYGHPFERDPGAVARDVTLGYLLIQRRDHRANRRARSCRAGFAPRKPLTDEPCASSLPQDAVEILFAHGLDEMRVEPHVFGAVPGVGLAVAGHGNQTRPTP